MQITTLSTDAAEIKVIGNSFFQPFPWQTQCSINMSPLPDLFCAPSEHDIFCTHEVNQMPMLFFLLLPTTGRVVSVKIIYTNCFHLMEIQSLQTVFFISGAWILREIVKYNWYHMLFIVFHMKEAWFSVEHQIIFSALCQIIKQQGHMWWRYSVQNRNSMYRIF